MVQQNPGRQFYRRWEVVYQTGGASHTLIYIFSTASVCDGRKQCKASLKRTSLYPVKEAMMQQNPGKQFYRAKMRLKVGTSYRKQEVHAAP